MKTIKTKLSLCIITGALQCNESGRIFNFPRQMVSMSVSAPLSIRTPHAMKDTHLYHSDAGFSVYSEGEMKLIHSSDMDLMARRLKKDNIVAFIERGGKIHLSPMSDGSVMMRTTIGGQGGGWLAARLFCGATYAAGILIPVAVPYFILKNSNNLSAIADLGLNSKNACGNFMRNMEKQPQDVDREFDRDNPMGELVDASLRIKGREFISSIKDASQVLASLALITNKYGPFMGTCLFYGSLVWFYPQRAKQVAVHYNTKLGQAAQYAGALGEAIPYI